MKTKKSKKVNLEKKKGLHFLIGAIITLSMILIAFEWSSGLDNNSRDINTIAEIEFEEQMIATRREEPKPPEAKQPEVLQVLDIVDDNVEVADFEFDFEVDDKTEYDFSGMDSLEFFSGSHPSVMKERVAKSHIQFNPIKQKTKKSFKRSLLDLFEKLTGYRIGEYKNYRIIK